jgi:hypothetical protein
MQPRLRVNRTQTVVRWWDNRRRRASFTWIAVCLCAPAHAQLGVQQLLQIPADPGQTVADLKSDSRGNLIVATLVPVSSLVSNGKIKKIDTAGNQVFSVALPSIFAPTLTVDANDDIEVNGFTTAHSAP